MSEQCDPQLENLIKLGQNELVLMMLSRLMSGKELLLKNRMQLKGTKTSKLVKLSSNKQPIVKWVFKVKHKPNSLVAMYKARLVAKGFLQREGLDFSKVFALLARLETMRLIVALVTYVSQALGFEVKGKEDSEFRMRKVILGTKKLILFYHNLVEYGIYLKANTNVDMILVCFYIDNLLIKLNYKGEIEGFKGKMKSKFDMTNLGELSSFLDIKFVQTRRGITVHRRDTYMKS
ncbi:hypothetical protein CR513_17104, partial [Mucuna pruriens]